MSKSEIKNSIGFVDGGHEFDMRPRFDEDTYREILLWSQRSGIKANPLLRALTKHALKILKDIPDEEAQKLLRDLSRA
jgi:hypothetical protein